MGWRLAGLVARASGGRQRVAGLELVRGGVAAHAVCKTGGTCCVGQGKRETPAVRQRPMPHRSSLQVAAQEPSWGSAPWHVALGHAAGTES